MASECRNNWGSNYQSLYERNQILLNNIELSDVKFRFDDDTVLFGHQYILASRSPVFEKMFCNWSNKDDCIQIRFTTANNFFKFLQYLYTDNVTWMRVYNVGPVMAIAHKYGVNHLVDLCNSYMSETLSTENACTYLEHCYPFNSIFINKLFSFIDEKCEDIIWQQSFYNLSIQPLLRIVQRDTLVVQENALFRALLDCTYLACKNARPNSETKIVFDQVRFPTMNKWEFDLCLQLAPNFFTEQEKIELYNYIEERDSTLHRASYNLIYPTVKREFKLIKNYFFTEQDYVCQRGNRTLSMRFRVANPIKIKEIEVFENDCCYYIQIVDTLRSNIVFGRYLTELTQGFSSNDLGEVKLIPNTTYKWKTSFYAKNVSPKIIKVSRGNVQVSRTIIFIGRGRSVIKKISFVNIL